MRHRPLTALVSAMTLVSMACGSSEPTLVTLEHEPLVAPGEESQAPVDRSEPPRPGVARPYVLPEVVESTLANGLAVTLIDRADFPTVSVRLSVRAGLDSSPDGPAISELTARLLRDGTETRDAGEIARFVEANGIDLDIEVEQNRIVLSADALSTRLQESLELLADLVARPTMPDERASARQEELLGELQLLRAQPTFHRNRTLRRVAFGDHPYSQLYPSPDAIESLTPLDLRLFHQNTYAPQRSHLVIVGALPVDVEAQVTTLLGGWDNPLPGPYGPPPAVSVTACNTAHVVLRPDSVQTSIIWFGPGIPMDAPDHISALTAEHILGGGPSSRLFMNLREDKSYTYGAYSRTTHLLGSSYFTAYADVRGEVTSEALDEFLSEFSRFSSEPIPEDEMADAIAYLSGVLPISLETNASLADRLSSLLDLGQTPDYLVRYRERVSVVTADEAATTGRKFIDPSALGMILVGREEQVLPAARAHASTVYVYDLDGTLLREEPGDLPSTCD